MSVNKVILVGNVGKNPEMNFIGDRPYARFTLATSEPAYTSPQGERVPEITEWKLRTRTWQDANAIKRNITEIIVERFDILSRALNN